MIEHLTPITIWLNANQGVVGVGLFLATILLGWLSGIFAALRHKPKFRISTIEGPTFVCTYGTGEKKDDFDVHRTGIALYLHISNVGSAAASIDNISVGYHWHIKPFGWLWWKYRIGWFWLHNQAVALEDFQVKIGEDTKFYPFMTQRSSISGHTADAYLEVGRSTNGVVYFEQEDSFGACFPSADNGRVKMRVGITDSFGQRHMSTLSVPRVAIAEAQRFNPSFGLTFVRLRRGSAPLDLPVDAHGNLIPPTIVSSADA